MQFLFSPLQGALSDSFGRRSMILISNFGAGLDYVLMALAPTLSWLFVGRVISGITTASISTAYAYVADVTPPDKRAARFGLLGAAFGAGFVLGPALGGLAGTISPRLPFWIAAGLSLANALLRTCDLAGIVAAGAARALFVAARQSIGRVGAAALAGGVVSARDRQLPRQPGARGAAEHQRAVHDVPLWLERGHRRAHPRRRRLRLDHCARLRRFAGDAVDWRASGVDVRPPLRGRGISDLRSGAVRVPSSGSPFRSWRSGDSRVRPAWR